ncbi:MAG TPA: DNA-3-methyladenine glycosylase [Bacteroidia bacterium]|jgi:DNA-3-methyladenine glycosylase|nr:DNA-3-methyladenine glycosylase [Bacteroidia bacterium]
MILPLSFYRRDDVVQISRELLGKYLVTRIHGKLTSGIITETEAYAGITDKASHAYGGKRTARTETMYAEGGVAYVYLCYGIHHLFNVVTNTENIPHAVLIRAVQPQEGLETILKRRGMNKPVPNLSAGPGTASQALGITLQNNGLALTGDKVWIEDRCLIIKPSSIVTGTRIGVDYAGKDAKRPYRFLIKTKF